jgi:hypothetical protein
MLLAPGAVETDLLALYARDKGFGSGASSFKPKGIRWLIKSGPAPAICLAFLYMSWENEGVVLHLQWPDGRSERKLAPFATLAPFTLGDWTLLKRRRERLDNFVRTYGPSGARSRTIASVVAQLHSLRWPCEQSELHSSSFGLGTAIMAIARGHR